LLGAVTDRSARLWVRTASEVPVTVHIFKSADDSAPVRTSKVQTSPQADYSGVLALDGLEPDTTYHYELRVPGHAADTAGRRSFRTYPSPGHPAKFRIGFGGGAGYVPWHERMWDTIGSFRLAGFFFLGDNVYIDLPEQPGALHHYTYYRRQSRPEFRRLVASTPIYAIWDDHDVAIDDVWLGPHLDKPPWKMPMLTLFKQNWNNPAYGNQHAPGCWFRMSIGDVDFFFLDCRFYRTNPFAPDRTMLGPVQKAWLKDQLQGSRARMKVLVSSVAWAEGAKPGSHDTWDGFPEEREEIFSWIEAQPMDGVLLLSADRHRSDAWRINRPGGYDLYDLSSSRLTNIHTHECLPGSLFCYNEKCSFGLLEFDTTLADPVVTYQIVNIDGQAVHSLELKRSMFTRSAAP
jgi:alkaline phosphatase D